MIYCDSLSKEDTYRIISKFGNSITPRLFNFTISLGKIGYLEQKRHSDEGEKREKNYTKFLGKLRNKFCFGDV